MPPPQAYQNSDGMKVLDQLLALARAIRRPRSYIGMSAFLLFGFTQHVRPYNWEGEERVDIIATYAPAVVGKCVHTCLCDAIATHWDGRYPHVISDDYPLCTLQPFPRGNRHRGWRGRR